MLSTLAFIGGLGGWEVLVIVFAILLLFGGRKIPELMRGIGKGVREFNTARASIKEELQHGMKEDDKKTSTSSAKED